MNKIIKFALGAAVIAPALIAGSAFAATFSNVQFDNGDVTITGQGGSTVQATFHVIVPAGQVVEYIQTDVVGDSLAPVDTSVGGDLGLQEGTHDVTVSVKLPPNTGTYQLNVQGAGIYGAFRSISGNDNVVGAASFSNALRVVADPNTTTGGVNAPPSWFQTWFANWTTQHPAPAPVPAPVSGVCADLGQYMSLHMGSTGQQVVQLQGLLLSKGASIPALAAGASFGYFGSQTNAALMVVKGENHCN